MHVHHATTPPTAAYLELVATPSRSLTAIMCRGTTPDLDALLGWEWRGTNLPATSRLLGIRRFIKGFHGRRGRPEGYNVSVAGSDLTSPWTERAQRDGRREWAPFTVEPVDPTATDNRYPTRFCSTTGQSRLPSPAWHGGCATTSCR